MPTSVLLLHVGWGQICSICFLLWGPGWWGSSSSRKHYSWQAQRCKRGNLTHECIWTLPHTSWAHVLLATTHFHPDIRGTIFCPQGEGKGVNICLIITQTNTQTRQWDNDFFQTNIFQWLKMEFHVITDFLETRYPTPWNKLDNWNYYSL